MVSIGDITKYLEPILPYVSALVLFVIPIYFSIGQTFAGWAAPVINLVPTGNLLYAYIIAGVIAVLGVVLGIKTDPEREE